MKFSIFALIAFAFTEINSQCSSCGGCSSCGSRVSFSRPVSFSGGSRSGGRKSGGGGGASLAQTGQLLSGIAQIIGAGVSGLNLLFNNRNQQVNNVQNVQNIQTVQQPVQVQTFQNVVRQPSLSDITNQINLSGSFRPVSSRVTRTTNIRRPRTTRSSTIISQPSNNYNIYILPNGQTVRESSDRDEIDRTIFDSIEFDENELISYLQDRDIPDFIVNRQRVPSNRFIDFIRNSKVYIRGAKPDPELFFNALNNIDLQGGSRNSGRRGIRVSTQDGDIELGSNQDGRYLGDISTGDSNQQQVEDEDQGQYEDLDVTNDEGQ